MQKLLAFLCTLILWVSCGKHTEEADNRAVFRMNLFAGLSTLDPAYASDQSAGWMCGQVFNGLLEFDSTLSLKPSLCRDWSVGDSGLTYRFQLRTDVWFHPSPLFGADSTRRMVAADVAYSFTRICDPSVAAKGFWIFNGKVAGVDAYHEGKAQQVSGFEVVDDSTFVIRLDKPFAPFPNLLAMAYASVVPHEVVAHYGKDFRSHPIGTGPFRFKSWNENVSLILLKNENYWEWEGGQRLPMLDAVQVRFIRERLTEFTELCQGRLDFVNGIDKATKDEVFDSRGQVKESYQKRFRFQMSPQLNTEYVAILVDSTLPAAQGHPLTDRRVRQALNYAIDRQALVAYVLNGNGYPATSGMIPSGMPGFDADSVPGFNFDPDRAARLLAEAGYPGGKGIPVLNLNSVPAYQGAMEFVQKSWERIGLTVAIENMDGPALREKASKGEINLWRAGWIADYPDGENYLGLFSSSQIPPNGPNRMRYRNATFDQQFALAQAEPRDSLRFAQYRAMERMVLQDAPVVLLYYDRIVRLVSPRVTGLYTNATNMLYLKRVRKAL
jgi:oligopeptide transport system substrate-binding protein